MRLSITSTLRWLRRSTRPRSIVHSTLPTGSAGRASTPASRIIRHSGDDVIRRDPSASASTRTRTLRRAARAMVSASRVPLLSGNQM
jgi:hypothetical protein